MPVPLQTLMKKTHEHVFLVPRFMIGVHDRLEGWVDYQRRSHTKYYPEAQA